MCEKRKIQGRPFTFLGGGGGGDLVSAIVLSPPTKKVDIFPSRKAVHDIELVKQESFLALGCCTKCLLVACSTPLRDRGVLVSSQRIHQS